MNYLKSISLSTENFNTNNAWGFGGSAGVQYNLKNDCCVKIGKYYYRHLPPQKFYTLIKKDCSSIEFKNITKLELYLKDNMF